MSDLDVDMPVKICKDLREVSVDSALLVFERDESEGKAGDKVRTRN